MADKNENKEGEYEVGYGKPPKETQFSSTNQPANKGRKPGSKGVKTMLKELLGGMDELAGGEGDHGAPVAQRLIRIAFGKKVNKENIKPAQALRALQLIMEYTEGKPVNVLQLGSEDPIGDEFVGFDFVLYTKDGEVIDPNQVEMGKPGIEEAEIDKE